MTDPTTHSQPAVDPALVARVKGILLQPKSEWLKIDGEFATTKSLFTRYAMILAAIGPVCSLLGGQLMPIMGVKLSIVGAIVVALVSYGMSLLGVFLLGLIINALAPNFGGTANKLQAMKLAVYSWTAAWLAGVFGLIPMLGILAILGLYSFYLLFVGLPILMKVPEDKKVGYFIVTVIAGVVMYFIISAIVGAISMSFVAASVGMAGLGGMGAGY
ncbi:Yip1 family protein [Brevundimonas sp. 'scallop']|uniref:Yip1 family protein n=1 Tax=Brevundimonas sp. 'scallop' TaxID=2562582 RepID=UPI0013E11B65|nr:Yip1 family protein [Brevundimonas sp. 'scallop']QIF82155.1 YIP1 family protein [Brevundimonas sp. 'scallop']